MSFLKHTKYLQNIYVKLVLFTLSIVLTITLVRAILAPIYFNEERDIRYKLVINKLKHIRDAQVMYNKVTGVYCDDFDKLSTFIDTANLIIKEVKDTSYMYYDKAYRMDRRKEEKIVRIIGKEVVKEKFKDIDYHNFKYIGIQEHMFSIKSGIVKNGNIKSPVFEVSIPKEKILSGLDKNLIHQEVLNPSVIRGEILIIGGMEKPSTAGNWSDLEETDEE